MGCNFQFALLSVWFDWFPLLGRLFIFFEFGCLVYIVICIVWSGVVALFKVWFVLFEVWLAFFRAYFVHIVQSEACKVCIVWFELLLFRSVFVNCIS